MHIRMTSQCKYMQHLHLMTACIITDAVINLTYTAARPVSDLLSICHRAVTDL